LESHYPLGIFEEEKESDCDTLVPIHAQIYLE
jgi:hypothetical protein